jgi:predicted RNA-binding Zn ribbon-like protein
MGMLTIEQKGSTVAVKAFDLLREATDQLVAAVEAQLSAAERDTDALKSALRMASAVVDQLYSASGALDARQATASPGLEQAEPSSSSVVICVM